LAACFGKQNLLAFLGFSRESQGSEANYKRCKDLGIAFLLCSGLFSEYNEGMDSTTLRQEAITLINATTEVLEEYLTLHNRLFSWKNLLGWNKFEDLKIAIPLVQKKLGDMDQQAKDYLEQAKSLADPIADKPTLVEFYTLLANYLDSLKMAAQIMGRLLVQIEAKSKKMGEFKQSTYETEMIMYKQKVDKYQLYGMQLNALINRLKA
jgi:hypothetical protein